jgi:two-component sensor histidine kinase/HAMP domain-containing protein
MLRFRDLPIQKKIMLMIVSVNAFALLLAFGVFAAYEVIVLREEAEDSISIAAAMIGYSSTGALMFDDPLDAKETLAGLGADSSIEAAWIYMSNGRPLATYVRDGIQPGSPPQIRPDGCYFEDGRLWCFHSISHEGVFAGTIVLKDDISDIQEILERGVVVMVAVVLMSFLASLVLSAQMQRIITGPIIRLAHVARSISKKRDYSVRKTPEAKDEIGYLVDTFNNMLDEVQAHIESSIRARETAEESTEKARRLADELKRINLSLTKEISARKELEETLRQHQKNLEETVQARTRQLAIANRELSREIVEREEAERKIRTALKEKTILLGEIHHRVRNNLQIVSSLLNLSKGRAISEEARQAIEEARSRIFTMALIHSQLHLTEDFSQIDMCGHIRKLWSSIHQIYEPLQRDVIPFIDCRDAKLTLTQAIPCALVLNEAVTNVFKHAYEDGSPGPCHISIERPQEDRIVMRVRDEGRGIPETIDVEKTDSLGLKLMRNLVRDQLGGEFRIQRNRGTDIWIEFDLLHEEPMFHWKSDDPDVPRKGTRAV